MAPSPFGARKKEIIMIICKKEKLSQKDQKIIRDVLVEYEDIYRDAYITKNNLRLFIKDNLDMVFQGISKGDYIAYDSFGVALVTGFSDNGNRKYLKILTQDLKFVEKLIRVIFWNLECDLWIKIKKNNPLKSVLLKNGFQFAGSRGKEILLVHKGEKHVSRNKR